MDGLPVGQVQGGGAQVQTLIPGAHEVSVQSGDLRAALTLEVADGVPPKISSPIQVKGLRVFVIVASGTGATWYGSETNIQIALDGRPLGELVKQGLEIRDLAAGAHELILTGPAAQPDKMVFESKSSPTVYVRMSISRRAKP